MSYLRRDRKLSGQCVQCGTILDREGSLCTRCNKTANHSKSLIVKKLHEKKLCTTCRKPLDREGWFCKDCTDKLSDRAKIRSAERRKLGLCVQCGAKTEGTVQCRRCLDMVKKRRNKKLGLHTNTTY